MKLNKYKLLNIREEIGDLDIELTFDNGDVVKQTLHYAHSSHDELEQVENGRSVSVRKVRKFHALLDTSSKASFERDIFIYAQSYIAGKEIEKHQVSDEVKSML